jgi:hypothetical protein
MARVRDVCVVLFQVVSVGSRCGLGLVAVLVLHVAAKFYWSAEHKSLEADGLRPFGNMLRL